MKKINKFNFKQRKSSLSIRTATAIIDQLGILEEKLKQAVTQSETNGTSSSKPSPTLYGRIEQANKWFANPYLDDSGLGHQAALLVIDEARRIIQKQNDSRNNSLLVDEEMAQVVYESEILLNQFLTAIRDVKNTTNDNNMVSIVGKNCQDKFYNLGFKITKAMIQQVADDFLDINHPLRKLVDVVMSQQGRV